MSDVLKGLWGKIYAWALPGALALGAYWLFLYPEPASNDWLSGKSDTEKAAIFIAITATLAFCLSAFSERLYRILEGYLLWPPFLQRWGTQRQLKRKGKLKAAATGTGWRRGLALEKLALYPLRDDQVVPTRFGNAIRSFEQYGKTRFNLDSQTMWYELWAVAPKSLQTEINSARSSVDFFVAAIYLSAALGLLSLAVAARDGFDLSTVIMCIASFAVTLIAHWMVVRATGDWGFTVQALVNVGRLKLADALGLQLPAALEQEWEMWGLVTAHVYFGNPEEGARLDPFRKERDERSPTATAIDLLVASPEPAEDDDDSEGDDTNER